MPLFDSMLDAQQLNPFCDPVKIIGAVGEEGRISHARKIYGEAAVLTGKLPNHTVPQHATGRHAVDKKNGFTPALVTAVHDGPPFFRR
jgi:hypothetical protein